MPNRILREGILTSERVNLLNWEQEVFYRRLMSVVDDYGRFSAHPSLLRAALYPLKLDTVRDANLERLLASVVQARLVRVYEAAGKRYLEMLDFRQQTRAKESRYPPPPRPCAAYATQAQSISEASAPVFGDGDGDGDGDGGGSARARAKRPPKVPMPEDFGVSPRVQAWATERGFAELPQHLDAFKRKVAAHGYRYTDWDAAFMEAVREDWAKLRGGSANGKAPPPESERNGGWHETRAGIESKGVELGIGAWDETAFNAGIGEQWPVYRRRVFAKAGHTPVRAA
jgi:hypothetical protein